MSRTRWIRNRLPGVLVLALGLVLALTSCSWFAPPQEATGAVPTSSPTASATAEVTNVQVEFPGRDDLQAVTEPVEQTPEMAEAAPAAIRDAVDIDLAEGQFPDTGAVVTFELDEAVDEVSAPVIAHWNEETTEWEVQPTTLSGDGMSISAEVEHFSIFAVIEDVYNTVNKVVGNFAESPECPGDVPQWADAVFLTDQNGPVLWCAGTDEKNPDIMEVRMVANRSSAMMASTAVEPVWAHSDVFGDTGPGTWFATAFGGATLEAGMTNRYLIPPKGEYRFGFAKDDLFEFWRTAQGKPLIQADVSSGTAVVGLVYGAAADGAGTAVAASVTAISLAECGHGIYNGARERAFSEVAITMLGCLADRKDTIIDLAAKEIAARSDLSWKDAKTTAAASGSRISFALGIYTLSKAHLTLGSLIGDMLIDPSAFQLHFTPSTELIRERLGRSGRETYTGEALDAAFSFDHPERWEIQETSGEMNEVVTVTGPGGTPLSELNVLLVWGAACGGPICEMQPVIHTEEVPGKQPLSHSGDFVVRTVVIDLSDNPEARDALDLEGNVQVVTSLTDGDSPEPTTLSAAVMHGVGQVQTGVVSPNGITERTVIFASYQGFATVEEAQEYVRSKQHQDVQAMIASFHG